MTSNYFLPADYTPNEANRTLEVGGVEYWSAHRLRDSLEYQWDVYRIAREWAVATQARLVLDVGCGPATKLVGLIAPVCPVTGVDQPSVIEWCRSRYPGIPFVAENLEAPVEPPPPGADVIVCSDVIEHMVDPDRLLAYLRAAAGADTTVLISTPCRRRLRGEGSRRPPRPEHIREWAQEEFVRYVSDRGFTVRESLLLPPVRTAFTALHLRHRVLQLMALRPFRYNHLLICRAS